MEKFTEEDIGLRFKNGVLQKLIEHTYLVEEDLETYAYEKIEYIWVDVPIAKD